MTTTNAFRTAARVGAASTPVALLIAAAVPAASDTPSTWEQPEPMSLLEALLIFGGITLALILGITLLVMAPSLIRGDRRRRGVASWTQPEWFGQEVTGSQQARPELTQGTSEQGGASARW